MAAKSARKRMATNETKASGMEPVSICSLDAMLAECLSDLSELGYTPLGRVIPSVRVTNNRQRLGSCKTTRSRINGSATHQISISTKMLEHAKDAWSTMYHEAIHTIPGCNNHGAKFKRIAAEVGKAYGAVVTTRHKEEGQDGGNAAKHAQPSLPTGEVDALIMSCVGKRLDAHGRGIVIDGVASNRPKYRIKGHDERTGQTVFVSHAMYLDELSALAKSAPARGMAKPGCSTAPLRRSEPKALSDADVLAMVGDEVMLAGRRFVILGIAPRRPVYRVRVLEKATGDEAFVRIDALARAV